MALPYLTSPNIGYGSKIITPINGNANGVAFIANEFDVTEPSAQTTRTTELGAPNGWIGFAERRTGRGQLQLATNVTILPERGDNFIYGRQTNTVNGAAVVVNVNFAFIEIGLPYRPRDFWVVDFQALESI
jgi:hypothetical protein